MTKRERAQVVELLRCAADLAATGSYWFWGPAADAARLLKPSKAVRAIATNAAKHAARANRMSTKAARDVDEFISINLEAALRVEEGSYP